jgi:hypothetical protein
VTASRQAASTAISCIAATPSNQIVAPRETAWVTAEVYCLPVANTEYVQVRWGDGTIEYYPVPVCTTICPAILPILVDTSHAYTSVGDYHPVFCLTPSPLSTTPVACTTVQILVVIVDPPVA